MENMTQKQQIILQLKAQIADQLQILENAQNMQQQVQQNMNMLWEKIRTVAAQPENMAELQAMGAERAAILKSPQPEAVDTPPAAQATEQTAAEDAPADLAEE